MLFLRISMERTSACRSVHHNREVIKIHHDRKVGLGFILSRFICDDRSCQIVFILKLTLPVTTISLYQVGCKQRLETEWTEAEVFT